MKNIFSSKHENFGTVGKVIVDPDELITKNLKSIIKSFADTGCRTLLN